MSRLSVLLLAVLCMATVACGAGGRSLTRARAGGKFSVSSTNGQGFAGGKVMSTDGEAKAAATVVAKAQSFAKSDLVSFFKKVSNAEVLAACAEDDKGPECCIHISSRIHENFWAIALAHAKSFVAAKAEVVVNGEGKACAGGQAAAKAFAKSFIQVVIDAIVEAYGYGYYESASASVNAQHNLFAKTYAEVNLVACAGDDSKATAIIKAAAEAYTKAIVEIYLRLNAQLGCRGTGSSDDNTVVKETPKEETVSQVQFAGLVDGTAHIFGQGKADAVSLFNNDW